MRISQLINHLNKIKVRHGDIEVYYEIIKRDIERVFVSSHIMEEYEIGEGDKIPIKTMKKDGYTEEDIHYMNKKYVIIE